MILHNAENRKRGLLLTKNQTAIEVNSLVKKYCNLTAVDSISFNVKKGEIFAFLGPNGAGKTTTVEILECIRKPTSGKAVVLGFDILKDEEEIKKRIGVLPQDFNTFARLTVKENIEYFAGMFGSSVDADSLIKLVDLEDKRNEQYRKLSGGLKQRLGVAIALVNDPEILFLDEPTAGLDPKARHEVWDAILGLKQKGKTIFLTTHYMEEAEILADTVTIIHKGKIVADGTPQELIERHGKLSLLILKKTDKAAIPLIETLGLTAQYDKETRDVKVTLNHANSISEVVRALCTKQIDFGELQLKKSTLEDVFLNLTGEKLKEDEAS
jgi:ABC-2 type transport system ATP-binding protein